MNDFNPGDIVVPSKSSLGQEIAEEGYILGEVIQESQHYFGKLITVRTLARHAGSTYRLFVEYAFKPERFAKLTP